MLPIVIFFFKDWIKLFVGGYKQAIKKEKTTPKQSVEKGEKE